MSKRRPSLLISLLFVFFNCVGQPGVDPSVWTNIEASIHQQKNLETTFNRLQKIMEGAQRNKKPAELARSLCYMMLIKDLKTEDSLYFHNSAFIDSILSKSSDTKLNLLMHYLQAQRLWKFRTKYLKFNRARYETKELPYNYAGFSNDQLDSLINYHFKEAKALNDMSGSSPERSWNIDRFLWLSSSPVTFLFRPTLADIISLEQINATKSIGPSYKSPGRLPKEWLSLSQDRFIDSLKALDRNESLPPSIGLYLQWLRRHVRDTAIYYFIETLSREYVYSSLSSHYDLDIQRDYEIYLKRIALSKYPEVKAKAISQLCFLWKEWSLKYAGDYNGHVNYGQPFDTSFRQYAAKAVKLYDENKPLFDDYGLMRQNLEQLKTEILFPQLQILLGYENEKSKPLLLKVQYKNVPVMYYRIVRLNFDEDLSAQKTGKEFLLSHKAVKEERINLPLPVDYNSYNFLKAYQPLVQMMASCILQL